VSRHSPLVGHLEVHVIDVGQGDAIWIRCPDGKHQLLIDTGDTRYPGSQKKFKSFMMAHQAKDDPIEAMVASHPHADHIGSMSWVLDQYQVKRFIDDGVTIPPNDQTVTYSKLYSSLHAKQVPSLSALTQGKTFFFDFCPLCKARVIVPKHFAELGAKDPNNASVIVRIDYGADSFLFTGDAESEEEALLVADPATKADLACDFLKVGHHGSDTSSTPAFLSAVRPKIAAISCGAKGVSTNAGYKHPRLTTLDALLTFVGKREGAPMEVYAYQKSVEAWKLAPLTGAVYVTTAQGDLLFESDGNGIHKK